MATPINIKHPQSGIIKRNCFYILLLMITLFALNACGDPELEARKEIQALGFSFDAKGFGKAVSEADSKIVDLFLTAGISKNRDATAYGLVSAIKQDSPEMLKLLLDEGADPNLETNKVRVKGGTPLTLAVSLEKLDMVKILLDKEDIDPNLENQKGDPEGRDGTGGTPLILAVSLQGFDMVELLLEKGANPNLESRKGLWKGQSPLKLAVDNGFAGVEEVLKAKGAK